MLRKSGDAATCALMMEPDEPYSPAKRRATGDGARRRAPVIAHIQPAIHYTS
jgi:hypothetical protein